MLKSNQGVLGIYSYVDSVLDGIKELKKHGFENIRVFSPVPNHEIENAIDVPESPVRFFTLIGGLFGATCGFAITALTAMDYPIYVSAKPIVSIPPFMVIVFELTVLFGALSTLAGLIFNSLLRRNAPVTMYDKRISDDKFGLMVVCPEQYLSNVEQILNSTGAEEVKFDSA